MLIIEIAMSLETIVKDGAYLADVSDHTYVVEDGEEEMARVQDCITLSQVYALEAQRDEIRSMEQRAIDEAIAWSLLSAEIHNMGASREDIIDLESTSNVFLEEEKAPATCCCCTENLAGINHRILPCHHVFCLKCIQVLCSLGVRNRSLVPAHCCKTEIPIEFVREALSAEDFDTYQRYMSDHYRNWTKSDLVSDIEYGALIKDRGWRQCPGCGVGVQKSGGCSSVRCFYGHAFCYECGQIPCVCQHKTYLHS